MQQYQEICINHLKTHKLHPRSIEIQRIQHAYLLLEANNTNLNVSNFDDGLIYIGTQFCFNHDVPKCESCPIRDICDGYKHKHSLIDDVRT